MRINRLEKALETTKELTEKTIVGDISKIADLGGVRPSNYRDAVFEFVKRIRSGDLSLRENGKGTFTEHLGKSEPGNGSMSRIKEPICLKNHREIAEEAFAYLDDYGITAKAWDVADRNTKFDFLDKSFKIFGKKIDLPEKWQSGFDLTLKSPDSFDGNELAFSEFKIGDDGFMPPEIYVNENLFEQDFYGSVPVIYREAIYAKYVSENSNDLISVLEAYRGDETQKYFNSLTGCGFDCDLDLSIIRRDASLKAKLFKEMIKTDF